MDNNTKHIAREIEVSRERERGRERERERERDYQSNTILMMQPWMINFL